MLRASGIVLEAVGITEELEGGSLPVSMHRGKVVCGHGGRGLPASQEVGSHQELTVIAPWSRTCSLQNGENPIPVT